MSLNLNDLTKDQAITLYAALIARRDVLKRETIRPGDDLATQSRILMDWLGQIECLQILNWGKAADAEL